MRADYLNTDYTNWEANSAGYLGWSEGNSIYRVQVMAPVRIHQVRGTLYSECAARRAKKRAHAGRAERKKQAPEARRTRGRQGAGCAATGCVGRMQA